PLPAGGRAPADPTREGNHRTRVCPPRPGPIEAPIRSRSFPDVLLAGKPLVELALGLLAAPPIAPPHLAAQLLRVALHLIEVVVGEVAPLLADLALELGPLPLEHVTVHDTSPCLPRVRPQRVRDP